MSNALIGYTGFVGSSLLRQTDFDSRYRSTNIAEIEGQEFDYVVCAGAPAQKWLANRDPEEDLKKIETLIGHLKQIKSKTFILISTVDVFKSSTNVDENTRVDETDLHPYGLHRRFLEKFVASHFDNYLIVRLPGLVGPGLQKNIIFDFLNNNNLHMIESRGVFQFYPMVNLWPDIQTALNAGLNLVHLTAEPVSVMDVAMKGFDLAFTHKLNNRPAHYDMKSCHAELYGGQNGYQYSAKETMLAIRAYAQSEPRLLKG